MASFEIYGGKPLKGELIPQGAKNEALQVLCAPLLTTEKVTISNVPDIIDVNKLINLLQTMGVKIEKVEKGTFIFQAKDIDLEYLETEDFKTRAGSLRGSIMIVGPLLARFGKGFIPKPGGDKIGRRRLDTHFEGFTMLGGKVQLRCRRTFLFHRSKKTKRHLHPHG
jgi:UDP-N-acetylglucosamine 1-carboxyvinyltransferase